MLSTPPTDSFSVQRARAKTVEEAVSAWLQQRGGFVLPAYDYSGLQDDKAPRLTAVLPEDSLIVPDLFCARNGRSTWVEVKLKAGASFTRLTQRLETGLSRRLWDHYLAVEKTTGLPVWLLFVHEAEQEMRGESQQALLNSTPRYYTGTKMGRAGMVFVPWDKMRVLATWNDLSL